MEKLLIVPIVEGYGDTTALPLLITRWLAHRDFAQHFAVKPEAVNAKSVGKLKVAYDPQRHLGIEHYVGAAMRSTPKPDAILVVLDADKECLLRERDRRQPLGPELLQRASAVAGNIPVGVVVANRTFEAWFLAARHALLRCALVRCNAKALEIDDPEARAGSKEVIGDLIGERYSPPAHQARLAEAISFSVGAQRRAPSLAKLVRELERLTRQARQRARQRRSQ